MNPLVRLLGQAVCVWFATVAFAVFCTVTDVTTARLWIAPCCTATVFLATAAGLAERAARKQAATNQEGRPS